MTWPAPKDKGGTSFVTVAGVRYQVEGTGHPYSKLVQWVKNGLTTIVNDDETGKGEE